MVLRKVDNPGTQRPLRRGRLRFLGGAAVNLEGTRDADTRGREIVSLKLARAEIRACSSICMPERGFEAWARVYFCSLFRRNKFPIGNLFRRLLCKTGMWYERLPREFVSDWLSARVRWDAPVGRGGDEPDGGRDRHGGPARPCAGLLMGGPLRAREHRLSFRDAATGATSPPRMPQWHWALGSGPCPCP